MGAVNVAAGSMVRTGLAPAALFMFVAVAGVVGLLVSGAELLGGANGGLSKSAAPRPGSSDGGASASDAVEARVSGVDGGKGVGAAKGADYARRDQLGV